MEAELLEAIRKGAELDYLSDLHAPQYRARVRHAISTLPESLYSPEQWRDAASYILRQGGDPNAKVDLKQRLIEALQSEAPSC